MHDPVDTNLATDPADPGVELARLRRRATRMVTVFAAVAVVWLAAGILATGLSDPTASAVLLAVSGAAVVAMTVLIVVLLRLSARVRGIRRRARTPPEQDRQRR